MNSTGFLVVTLMVFGGVLLAVGYCEKSIIIMGSGYALALTAAAIQCGSRSNNGQR